MPGMPPRQRHWRGIEQIPWLYDGWMTLAEATGLGRWRRALVAGATGGVLDVGCGTGRNLPLYGPGSRVVGVDRDLRVLRVARRRGPAAHVVAARVEALPFRSRAFDAVVSGLVFCSVDDPVQGLREVRRVLTPQGQLRMLEHVRSPGRLRARLQDWIQPCWTWLTGGCRPNRDTEGAVEAAGFTIDRESRAAKGVMRLLTARAAPG